MRHRRRWRQIDLALRAGVSATVVSRIEHGRLGEVSIESLERVALALDIRLSLSAWWRGGDLDRMLNSRHAALAERAIAWVGALGPWIVRPEVSFAIDGERGVIDLVAWWPDRRALLVAELKTDIVDVAELLGTFSRKQRLARRIAAELGWEPDTIGSCVLIDEGRTNRRRVAAHAATFRAALPDDGRRLRAWLRDPQGALRALAFLPDPQSTNVRHSPATVRRVRPARAEGGRRIVRMSTAWPTTGRRAGHDRAARLDPRHRSPRGQGLHEAKPRRLVIWQGNRRQTGITPA